MSPLERSDRRHLSRSALSLAAMVLAALAAMEAGSVDAATISEALAQAYAGNPDLNQQRAGTRAADEVVARAKSGYRPQVKASGTLGYEYTDGVQFTQRIKGDTLPTTAELSVDQSLFDGYRTTNGVRKAESQVFQSRAQIRQKEQSTLQDGATVYMNVLRDAAVVELNRNNITVLNEQLRQTRDRYLIGDVTRTDEAQAAASLASARSAYFTARATLMTSLAGYRQVIGHAPKHLEPARPIDALLPHTLSDALVTALSENPQIDAALHAVDAAALQVQIEEGALYPSVDVVASVQQGTAQQGYPRNRTFKGTALIQLSVPIYSGGETFAAVRQAKELLSQARLQADLARDQIRAAVMSAWGQLDAAKAVIRSSKAAARASEIALNGVRMEARVGQRTTYDVLVAEQTLVQSRVTLVSAQRDRVVASYAVMAAIGRLSAINLGLDVVPYDPAVHFDQVKDKWIGLRTADGR